MITAVTTTVTTTTTTTTTAAVGANIVGIGIFAIVLLVVLLILRDISMVELENRRANNSEQHSFLSSFVNSSGVFIIPLCYVFLSIIVYKVVLVV